MRWCVCSSRAPSAGGDTGSEAECQVGTRPLCLEPTLVQKEGAGASLETKAEERSRWVLNK